MVDAGVKERIAGGLRWSYREVDGKGPALLFLHAFPLQKAMWEPALASLAGERRAVAVDLPGFGGSAPWPGEPSLEAYAGGLVALLDALGLEKVVPCGLSMGGYLTLALWRRYRERIAGMVLADTRAGADSDQAREGRRTLMARVREEGPRAAADQFLPNLVGPTTRARQPQLLSRLEGWILANSPEGIVAALEAMASRPDSTHLLGSINVPALVVVGEEDSLTTPAEAEQLAAAIPGARLARIAQAGHLSAVEQPEAFNQALADFLARLDTGG